MSNSLAKCLKGEGIITQYTMSDTPYNKIIHYQKIDKYKRKYQGNIFVAKLSMDFTDGNIPSVFTEGITMGKIIIKTKQKN